MQISEILYFFASVVSCLSANSCWHRKLSELNFSQGLWMATKSCYAGYHSDLSKLVFFDFISPILITVFAV